MTGVYFSGTGNTKHCAERLMEELGGEGCYSIEDERAVGAIKSSSELLFAYPIYYSSLPKIVSDFIARHASLWSGKRILVLCTMGLFSGDGAGVSARLFRKYGATVTGGLHVKMPDCIGDVKLLKKPLEENKKIVSAAEEKIRLAARRISAGNYPKNGLGACARLAGLFGQRLYFGKKTKRDYGGVRIDPQTCAGCGLCASLCPKGNLVLKDRVAIPADKCTMCYRCFSNCPKQAITVLGKRVYEQSKIEKYL